MNDQDKTHSQLRQELSEMRQRAITAEEKLANLERQTTAASGDYKFMKQKMLTETAEILIGVLDLEELWSIISAAAEKILAADRTAVYLYDAETDELSCPFAIGLSSEYIDFINHQFRQVPGSQLLHQLAPVVVNDVATDPATKAVRESMLKEGFQAYAVFPLTAPVHTIVGALVIYRNQLASFSEEDITTGYTLAHIVAMAIRNITLLNETRHSLLREQRLNQITRTLSSALDLPTILANVVRMATELVDADAGMLGLLLDSQIMTFYPYNLPDNFNLRPAVKGRDLAWKIVDERLTLLIETYASHPLAKPKWIEAGVRTYLGVPLTVGDECLGALSLVNLRTTRKQFTDRDRALAESVGRQAGIAIQNARMFAETRQRANALASALNRHAELDNLKNQFIQSVSHELRTPLGIIYGHAELLESGGLGELQSEQHQSIQIIARRVRMLTNLVDDLTALLAAETQELRREEINPVYLIYSMLADYQIQAEEFGITLNSEIEEELPMLKGDPTHLRRVFDNLISNAFKYSPKGGSVTIRMWGEGTNVVMEVADTGEGIPADHLARIFERFYQVDGGRHAGTGLGLALVKEIVEAHRGEVTVSSTVDVGTTFRITIPGYIG